MGCPLHDDPHLTGPRRLCRDRVIDPGDHEHVDSAERRGDAGRRRWPDRRRGARRRAQARLHAALARRSAVARRPVRRGQRHHGGRLQRDRRPHGPARDSTAARSAGATTRRSATGNGSVGTWSTDMPALLGSPIDHVLASEHGERPDPSCSARSTARAAITARSSCSSSRPADDPLRAPSRRRAGVGDWSE